MANVAGYSDHQWHEVYRDIDEEMEDLAAERNRNGDRDEEMDADEKVDANEEVDENEDEDEDVDEDVDEEADEDKERLLREEAHPDPARPNHKHHIFSGDARDMFLRITTVCETILDALDNGSGLNDPSFNAINVLSILCSNTTHSTIWNTDRIYTDDSLDSLASQCALMEQNIECSKFMQYLALMHFRTKVESIYRDYLKSGNYTGKMTINCILESISLEDPKTSIRFSTKGRKPDKGSQNDSNFKNATRRYGDWVKKGSMLCMMSGAVEDESSESSEYQVWSSELEKSDDVFDSILFGNFITKRNWEAWSSCITGKASKYTMTDLDAC
ncbi:hypothetical protein CVT25_004861 [Psilocybe cyanescens]|uniref:Uncharacterized protein n=1 Tax=Psilocybe cyanescens TaxID=93625 RepID=A0A409XGM3_PSICY|nr:hypothetical protein CVT25_004861 [Psilocybe cyanescens]